MGIIDLDFQSIVIGYAVGVALMWSLCEKLYGESDYGKETDLQDTRPSFDRRNHYLYNRSPE